MADIRVRVGQQNAVKVISGATPGTQGLQGVQGSYGPQGLAGAFAGQGVQGSNALAAASVNTINATGVVTAYNFVGFSTGLVGINVGNTYYVSVDGNDSNDGLGINRPFRTVKTALQHATSGDNVHIGAGTFSEIFPLTIPQGVSIKGSGIRGTFIQPTEATKQNDCFLMNGETEVTDLTIGNMYEPGWAFRFASNMKTTLRSPYVQRVTVLNRGTGITTSDPYGFNTVHNPTASYKAGRGVLIDGSVADPSTLEPAMLFNECTFICPNNTALEMTNGARTEWVNCFSYFADKAIYGHSGNVGLGSTGKTRIKLSGVTIEPGGGAGPSPNDLLYYFDENSKSGAFTIVGTAATITYSSHGLSNNDRVYVDFTGSAGINGIYSISGVTTNTFNVTTVGSATSTGTAVYKKAVGYGTIYSYSNGLVLLSGKGNGTFATAASRSGKQVVAYGDAKISTAQFKFGTGSAQFDSVGDYLQITSDTAYGFGVGGFTLECFVRITSTGADQTLIDLRSTLSDIAPNLLINSSNQLVYSLNGSDVITGTTTLSPNIWYHVALTRNSGSTKIFVDGVQDGSTYSDTNNYGNSKPVRIGANYAALQGLSGYIDEIRISNTGRYTGTFVPTTTAFVSDSSTKLLLHCDGNSGSVIFSDSTLVIQDIRVVGPPPDSGNDSIITADQITLADYQQFGADMRSIGSAAVFGNTGITADGLGVKFRLFAFNFGHIGSGGDFSQDESLVIQANEAIESNGGKVLFVSIDQGGDFRVGKSFYVNEEQGYVTFGGQTFNISSLSNLDVTDGTNTTTITPTAVNVGNVQVTGNEVSTTSGDLEINPSGVSSTRVVGDLTVTGSLNYNLLAGADGDKGDITVTNNFATWTIDNGVVNFNKVQNITSGKVLGRSTAGVGTVEQLSTSGSGDVVLSTSPVISGISTVQFLRSTNAVVSGVVTATAFVGDGTGLTGVTALSISTSYSLDTNYIAFVSSASTTNIGIAQSNLVVIPSSGNIGIGTTLPLAKIHSVGVSGVSESAVFDTPVNTMIEVGDENSYSLAFRRSDTGAAYDVAMYVDSDGVLSIYGGDKIDPLNSYPICGLGTNKHEFYVGGGMRSLGIDQTGSVILNTSQNTGTSNQKLQVTGGAYISGNVGVGITNPTSKLQVTGGDIRVGLNTSQGLILTSPNGTKYRLFVDDSGTLSTVIVA